MIIVVTGADGFIGARVSALLEGAGHEIRRIVRRPEGPGNIRHVVAELATVRDWHPLLRGADAVLHLAARAHVMSEQSEAAASDAFLRTNVLATELLARHAAECNVRRFVFMSSIGVNGSASAAKPFDENDVPNPTELYAHSKLEAELRLRQIAAVSQLEVVILRPPLVYGAGAKGNYLRLLRLASSGVPLPLGSLNNRRSLVGLGNLCDVIGLSLEVPAAAGQTLLVAEPQPRSTAEVLRAMYGAFGMRDRLFPCPPRLLAFGARLAGYRREFEKMCLSLEINPSRAMQLLHWRPRHSFDDEIAASVHWYARRGR